MYLSLVVKWQPVAELGSTTQSVEKIQRRLNREIAATQKLRDDSRRTLGREYDPIRVKAVEQVAAIDMERFYSDPPADSKLAKPFRSAGSAPDSHRHIYG